MSILPVQHSSPIFVQTQRANACGNSDSGKPDAASGQAQSSIQTDNSVTADSSETNRENENSGLDSKILIAYFTAAENSGVDAISSASYTKVNGEAVGRIRAVADMIADNTGGELFSIKTETVYPTHILSFIYFSTAPSVKALPTFLPNST